MDNPVGAGERDIRSRSPLVSLGLPVDDTPPPPTALRSVGQLNGCCGIAAGAGALP